MHFNFPPNKSFHDVYFSVDTRQIKVVKSYNPITFNCHHIGDAKSVEA